MADYIFTMESRLTPEQSQAVKLVQQAARKHGVNLYLTGGAIRDVITGFAIRDLDFTVQGNPHKLLKDLVAHGAKPNGGDEATGTLRLILPGNIRAEIVMSHAENYPKPGKPPVITPATITEDLRRRDFTVNAMALSLNIGSLGLLLDPSNGIADVEAQKLRILHNYSFYEDPSRLIRIVRFGARFHGWEMEERTAARYAAAKENNYIDFLRKESISYELEQIAFEDDPVSVIKALEHEGWLKLLHPHLSHTKIDAAGLQSLGRQRLQMWVNGFNVEGAPAALHLLLHKLNSNDQREVEKLLGNPALLAAYRSLETDSKALAKLLTSKEAAKPSQAWTLLTQANPDVLLYLWHSGKQAAVTQKINDFFGKWRREMEKLPYAEMTELRITPQLPDYAQLTHQLFLQLIDGKLKNHSELVAFLEPYSPPLPPPPPPTMKRRVGKASAKSAAKKSVAPPAPVVEVKAESAEPKLAPIEAKKPETAPEVKTPAVKKEAKKEAKKPESAKVEVKAPAVKAAPKAAPVAPAKVEKKPANSAKAVAKPVVVAKPAHKVVANKAQVKAAPPVSKKPHHAPAKAVPIVKKTTVVAKKPQPVVKKAPPKATGKVIKPVAKSFAKPVAKVATKSPVRVAKPLAKASVKVAPKAPVKAVKVVKAATKVVVKAAKPVAKPSKVVAKSKGKR